MKQKKACSCYRLRKLLSTLIPIPFFSFFGQGQEMQIYLQGVGNSKKEWVLFQKKKKKTIALNVKLVDMTDWFNRLPLDSNFPEDSIDLSPLWQVLYGSRDSQNNHQQ